VRYGYEFDPAFPAGAIIDQNRRPVSHVQRFFFDDDLGVADTARGDKQDQCCRSHNKHFHVESPR
jgi:hypothetical protein